MSRTHPPVIRDLASYTGETMTPKPKKCLWPADCSSPFVYFMRSGQYLKIGACGGDRLVGRFKTTQTYSPHRLKLWLAIPCNSWDSARYGEMEYHQQFAHLHMRGEWFRLSEDLVVFVRGRRRTVAA
jgi:hypothetical protein